MERDPLRRARDFLAAIEANAEPETVFAFFAPDAVQEEFPNRLLPLGATRDTAALREAYLRGRALMARQTYEVVGALVSGDQVLLESRWEGELAVPVGALKAGDRMRARFAQVFEFRDGLIHRLRNYDCFEAW